MLIIPERKTVLILNPRTGTNYLKTAVRARYAQAFMPYRHMEADGIPFGYQHYKIIGVFRSPLERLWSLYKYLKFYDLDNCAEYKRAYMAKCKESAQRPFNTWLCKNTLPVATPYGSVDDYHPQSAVKHLIPENRKSQWHYLRPDLGTIIVPYPKYGELLQWLDVPDVRTHQTPIMKMPKLTAAAKDCLEINLAWDFLYDWDLKKRGDQFCWEF